MGFSQFSRLPSQITLPCRSTLWCSSRSWMQLHPSMPTANQLGAPTPSQVIFIFSSQPHTLCSKTIDRRREFEICISQHALGQSQVEWLLHRGISCHDLKHGGRNMRKWGTAGRVLWGGHCRIYTGPGKGSRGRGRRDEAGKGRECSSGVSKVCHCFWGSLLESQFPKYGSRPIASVTACRLSRPWWRWQVRVSG